MGNKIWGSTDNAEIDWVTVLNFKKEREISEMQSEVSELLDYLLVEKRISPSLWQKMKSESRETAKEIYVELTPSN